MRDNYQRALEQLNEQQRRAVMQLDGPVLVIAGPGTGKTQLLSTRIAHILKTTDTLPQNILCLTFTDSAVTAMRERLANLIGKEAYDVTISTYHAFGNDLIGRFPDYFMQVSDYQAIDELGIDGIVRELIAELPYNNPLRYADSYIGDIRSLIADLKKANLRPVDVRTVAEQNERFLQQAAPLVQESLQGMVRMSKTSVPLFARLLEKLQAIAPDLPEVVEHVIPLGTMVVSSLEEALEEAAELGNQKPLTTWKNGWLEKNKDNELTIAGKKTVEKLRSIADIYERYNQELQARQHRDYEDMILEPIAALEANEDFRFSLQERYLYILLDEFQDTNGSQAKLVSLLSDNPVFEGRPDILAVGDDDQAIYAFQGADYSNMSQFQGAYRDVLTINLTDNYRSQPGILHTAHGIAGQIQQRLLADKTLVAKAPTNPETVVTRVEAKSDVEQFAWIAKQIEQLHKKGTPLRQIAVLAPKHKYLEPLVPFLHQAGLPVQYEKRENVLDDPAINELLRMAELALALKNEDRALANMLWPEVLSSSCWDLPTSRIWQLSWQAADEREDWTARLLDSELRTTALFFIRLGLLARDEPLEPMLDYLIGTRKLDLQEPDIHDDFSSPFYEHYFGGITAELNKQPKTKVEPKIGLFWQLLTNLTVLRAHLSDYRADMETLHLADLLEFVEAHRNANVKVPNTSPYQDANDAVQLMTAFKAKGQEFDTVFVIACNDDVWGGSARGQGSRLSLPQNLQFVRYDQITDDERLRLFYVAITRAKAKLYLVNYAAGYNGKTATRLRYLEEQADEQGAILSPLLPSESQAVQAGTATVAPTAEELTAYWQERHTRALSQESLRSLLQERLRTYQLSPTDIGQFTDLEYAGPEAFLLYNLLRFPQAPTPELQYGNAVHETLHWIHLANKKSGTLPTLPAVIKKFEGCLKTRQLTELQVKHLKSRGQAMFKAYLEQRTATISPDNECELSFRHEGVFLGEAHMSGKIDKLIIDKKAKTITIVDYKTGQSHTRWERSMKLHKYRHQLYYYKLFVEHSHSFAGYTVTDAYVEFVEPDEDGEIRELHLQFSPQEQQNAEKLAEAVWQCVKALELPSVSHYPANIAGTEAFEKQLSSGQGTLI